MGEIVNPYIAGAPVIEQRMFFGREDIFQWIENSIAGQYADHILVIHGQRRVGKTSVLKQLGNRLPKRYIPVFFDLQGRTHTTLDRFLWWLAREIVRVLKQERGIEVSLPEKEDFARDLEHFENRFLPDLQPALNGSTLLLTFDEFDNLEDSEIKEELGRPLVDHLRRLMGSPGLNFIFSIGSSGRKLENMQASYTNFFKTALYKKISFLNEEQTHGLITRPVKGVLEYERAAVGRIYQIASGHPYFTQLTCHELFARCQRTEQRRVAESDVEAILEDVVERGTVNLKFVWDEATDIEKWSLSALAHLDKSDTRAVAEYLRRQHVRFSESDLTSGLLRLREKDVLTPENRFVIHLLRLWLQKNRPIEQAREELTEVNPIANRYIEIGLEFKDSRLYEKAIESFQEALAISKDNLQAQVNIALTFMDQNLYDKAIVEFEKALTMDDEDVSARAGLCEAHLALGDAAMNRSRMKDAVLSYQRVLAINAEHTEARGRMAEISCQRAEKALLNGKDEDALSAFTEALRFTPEDPKLIARVEQFRQEKKRKILVFLLAGAEKEAGAGNWDAAIKSLEEALPLSPTDGTIPKKLVDARVAQQKEGALAAVYADAQKAYTEKNYDQAVSLFKKIILEDENYRDASRLLTQAIELRRTAPKWWQRKAASLAVSQPRPRTDIKPVSRRVWMVAGVLAMAVVLGVGAAFWFGLFAAPAAVPTQIVSPSTVAAPVSALDPELQAALDTIQNEEPLYQTSFDDWDSDDTGRNAALVNGKLVLTSEDENGATLGLNAFPSDRYAVEFELSILGDSSPDGDCVYEVSNNAQVYGESWRAMSAMFFLGGQTVLGHYVHPDQYPDLVTGDNNFDFSKSSLVTLIFLGDQITAFINGQLAYTAQDPAGSAVYFGHSLSAYNQVTCGFDHFKYWDLREMDAAVKTALATIHSEAPTYQTSFDSWELGELPDYAKIDTGKLMLTSEGEHVGVDIDTGDSDSFAVEFEFRMSDASPAGHCVVYAQTEESGESQKGIAIGFFSNGSSSFDLSPQEGTQEQVAYGEFDPTTTNTVTLVVIGDQLAVFMNDQPFYSVRDPYGGAVYTYTSFAATYAITCEYDNYKFWDLNDMDPAVKIALAAVQSEEPLYQTSFDTWEFGEPVDDARVENGKLILSSPVAFIEGTHVSVTLDSFRLENFAAEFEFRGLNPSDNGHCIFYAQNDGVGEEYRSIATGFHISGEGNLDISVQMDTQENLAVSPVDIERTNKITLLVLGDQIFVLKNGQLMFNVLEPRVRAVYTHMVFAASHKIDCEYDNFKVWDLSGVDFSATTTTTAPTSSFASILASNADKTPAYEDDFSSLASGWPTDRDAAGSEIGYQDDAYLISAMKGCYGANLPTDQVFSDFVLELDARFIDQGQGTVSILFRNNGPAHYGANLSPQGWVGFHKNVNDVHIPLFDTEIPTSSFQAWDTPKHMTLIARQNRMAIYVNGALHIALTDSSSSQGQFNFSVCADSPLQALIDNLKIWDIAGLSP